MNVPHASEGTEVSNKCVRFWDGYYQCISRIGSNFRPKELSQGQIEAFGMIERIIGEEHLGKLLEQNMTKNDRGHLEAPEELRKIFDTASKLTQSIHLKEDTTETRKILFELMQFAVNINKIDSIKIHEIFEGSPLSQETKLAIVETYLRTRTFPTPLGYDPKTVSLFTQSIREIFEGETGAAISTVISQHLKEAEEILRKSKESS